MLCGDWRLMMMMMSPVDVWFFGLSHPLWQLLVALIKLIKHYLLSNLSNLNADFSLLRALC